MIKAITLFLVLAISFHSQMCVADESKNYGKPVQEVDYLGHKIFVYAKYTDGKRDAVGGRWEIVPNGKGESQSGLSNVIELFPGKKGEDPFNERTLFALTSNGDLKVFTAPKGKSDVSEKKVPKGVDFRTNETLYGWETQIGDTPFVWNDLDSAGVKSWTMDADGKIVLEFATGGKNSLTTENNQGRNLAETMACNQVFFGL